MTSSSDEPLFVAGGDVMGAGQHNELALLDRWGGQPMPGLVVSVRKRNAGSGMAVGISPDLVAQLRDALTAHLVATGREPAQGGGDR